jgi:hypothetical protein
VAKAGQPGLEPGTFGFGDRRYHQLSYCPVGRILGASRPDAYLHICSCRWLSGSKTRWTVTDAAAYGYLLGDGYIVRRHPLAAPLLARR